ncbi:arsenite methyltransferase [Thermodesulfobacteriota bacterium]
MDDIRKDEIHSAVREHYAEAATKRRTCCESSAGASCCETAAITEPKSNVAGRFDYSPQDLSTAPDGSYAGLGCGNPLAMAMVSSGDTILDLGSGTGFDCFLAAEHVGKTGRVIGVDMTPEMLSKARNYAKKKGHGNVEFRLGEIENLPVADESVDLIISNCVINLSPDKPKVFSEAYRVLKPGGRIAIADMVASASLPGELQDDLALYCACLAGAALVDDVKAMLTNAGFDDVKIQPRRPLTETADGAATTEEIADVVTAAMVEATKPC